ncbi:MAG: hypothetical protein COV67_00715 [Nitrospinae bacterium CG11_big_fil_rev_8_21_14_0_20_56_8]|nr:MAG: hypothetical protein COV67_00715 [Nitrospinae bacterium CG11_big_fil_rev_8_21_14_0_20_56_8]
MNCPKCQAEQPVSDTCIHCGIVFAKYREIQQRKSEPREPEISASEARAIIPGEPAASPAQPRAGVPLDETFWRPVSFAARAGLLALLVFALGSILIYGVFNPRSLLVTLAHNANLIFHEAGHVLFGMFGNETLGILGGSLGQLMIPLLAAGAFYMKRDAAGFSFGLFWFFESLLDVALYMADARLLELELIGGLGMEAHDWRNLFNRWDLWNWDGIIVAVVRGISWTGLVLTPLWLFWLTRRRIPQERQGI